MGRRALMNPCATGGYNWTQRVPYGLDFGGANLRSEFERLSGGTGAGLSGRYLEVLKCGLRVLGKQEQACESGVDRGDRLCLRGGKHADADTLGAKL